MRKMINSKILIAMIFFFREPNYVYHARICCTRISLDQSTLTGQNRV